MDVTKAMFWRIGSQKELADVPKSTECSLRVHIGEFADIEFALWEESGSSPFANIRISSAKEMKQLAALLLATAKAKILADA